MSFFVSLWQSIFEPGTSPQLVVATHISFTALLLSLVWLIYSTGIIHFYVLFAIAALLWLTVIWFIQELKQVQLKSNNELEASTDPNEKKEPHSTATSTATSKATATVTSSRSRKT